VGIVEGIGLGDGDGIREGLGVGSGVVGASVGDVEGIGVGSQVSHESENTLSVLITEPILKTSHRTSSIGGVFVHFVSSPVKIATAPSAAIIAQLSDAYDHSIIMSS